MKLFEMINPWRIECEELRSRCRENKEELHRLTCELHKYQDVRNLCVGESLWFISNVVYIKFILNFLPNNEICL